MTRLSIEPAELERRLSDLEELASAQARLISELRNQGALKTQFLSNISHDLRTPLTAIITHAEILRDGLLGELSERQHDSVGGIISAGRQLLDMVGEILTYAKGAANQLTLSRNEFTVTELVDQVVALSESLVSKKGHVIEVQCAEGLPPLYADREKIAHALGNLVSNAIDFTPPGGRVWIHAQMAEASERGSGILFEVGDTGIGIAPEHFELIFREFAQVDASASRQHHGTGLGLAIARKFVELHDGKIWVDSTVGEGSRFYFTIPLRSPR